MNHYRITLRRGNGTEASFELHAADDYDALTDASYLAWLAQFMPGCWPFYRVTQNGSETGLPLTLDRNAV